MNTISNDTLASLGLTANSKKSVGEQQQADEKAQKDKLGQADFLMMMTQQLKNQDPLNPMENGAFLAQLAQISTVQEVSDLNKKADAMMLANGSNQAFRGAELIGRQVQIPGSTLTLTSTGKVSASIEVSGSGPVEVAIQDANGNPVRAFSLPGSPSGPRQFDWDGKDAYGNRLASGSYRIVANQIGADDKPVALKTSTNAVVESVSLDKNGATLNLPGGQEVPLDQVKRIS
jgi:flagellar basal-body rod modification protein FlgD